MILFRIRAAFVSDHEEVTFEKGFFPTIHGNENWYGRKLSRSSRDHAKPEY